MDCFEILHADIEHYVNVFELLASVAVLTSLLVRIAALKKELQIQ